MDPLFAVSPLDGRYAQRTEPLRVWVSEFALIKARVFVEVQWLLFLVSEKLVKTEILSEQQLLKIRSIADAFTVADARRVKELEKITNHDVKAVEHLISEKLVDQSLSHLIPFVHFACTSEDVNNVAYAVNLQVIETADTPLLALTHGQPASPTTLGKELAVFFVRLCKSFENAMNVKLCVKWNGATGTFAAHAAAVSTEEPWFEITSRFLESMGGGFVVNHVTTQIEPHDGLAELLDAFARMSSVLIDLCQDVWMYISRGVLRLRKVETETGSSVMPHKVNPIDFENAEGNLHIANALFTSLARRLPISRLQRDLTDSTCLRALGEAFGHFVVAVDSVNRGLKKIAADDRFARRELEPHFEILAEALQTCMRGEGIPDAYEQLKRLTRGRGTLTAEEYREILEAIALPEEKKRVLAALTPSTYVGEAPRLARLAAERSLPRQ